MKIHHTDSAPKAVGPYSQAVSARRLALHQRPGRASTRPPASWSPGGFEPQARQVLANLRAILRNAGVDFDRVVKATVFLADLGDFAQAQRDLRRGDGRSPAGAHHGAGGGAAMGAAIEIDMVARL